MSDPLKLLLKEPFTRLSRRFLALAADGTLTPAEHLLATAVADKTVSWRRLWEELTYDDLQDATGLSRQKVRDGLAALRAANVLARKPVGRSFAYALVPIGMTVAELEALAGPEFRVDKDGTSVYSGDRGQSTQETVPADPTYIVSKKDIRRPGGRVDKGLRASADTACSKCHGEGWIVLVEADGFTESVARCLCTT